ncbi:MFS transporter [Virgibacillus salarius]
MKRMEDKVISEISGQRRSYPTVTLIVVLVGVLVIAMSIAGTAVAVPQIGVDLSVSGAPLHWVVAAYNLTFAAFTLVFGSLADLFGRRRTFIIGSALFVIGSLISAISNNIFLMDAARALAGIGGAGVMASGGAILATTFNGPARMRAFAALGTMAGVGIAIGPFLSGWLVGEFGWRSIFLIYLAIGVLILIGTLFISESRGAQSVKVDWPGMLTFIVGFTLIMFGIMQGPEIGWGSPVILTVFVVGIILLSIFVFVERRSTLPVLNLKLIKNTRFMAWCISTLITSVGFLGVLVFLPVYLQGVNQISAEEVGVIMLILTAPVLVIPQLGGWLVNRGVSTPALIGLSLLLIAAGNAWLTVIHPGVSTSDLFGPLLMIGVGMGISFGITDGQAMSLVDQEQVGMAAGFLNTIRGGSEALVIAVFGAVLVTLLQVRVKSAELAEQVAAGVITSSDSGFLSEQFTEAWQVTLWGVAAICATMAVVVYVMLVVPKRYS